MNKTKEWAKARKKLKVIYGEKGITTCELCFENCWKNNALSFAHFKKRRYYYSRPELIGSFYQTILCCINCHNIIEYNSNLTKKVFYELRGKKTFEEWNEEIPKMER